MARKPVTLAAFEVAPGALRFVEMARDERRVLAAATIPLEEGRWLDGEHLAARARSLFTEAVRGKPARMIASVPARHAHFRVIDAPAAGADEYLAWDMERYLARPRDEYAFAFSRITAPSVPSGTERHVAAAFDRAQAALVRDALASATKLPLVALDIDAAAIANATRAAHPDARSGRALVVQAERHAASALRLQDGVPAGFAPAQESGVVAADALADSAQDRAEALMKRAHGIRDALRGAGAAWETPERAWLCGELAASEDFRELLRAQTGITFRLLNPFANLPGPDPADFPGAWPGAPYTAAVGLALRLAEES
jgi:Tfp pilus assembly PilM family ATPase